jgi:hypothetical protein
VSWLETYASLAVGGAFQPRDPSIPAPYLFPSHPSLVAACVTRGISISVSTLYAPEMSRPGEALIAYHIHMELLPAEPSGRGDQADALDTMIQTHGCQLLRRRWHITAPDGSVETVCFSYLS